MPDGLMKTSAFRLHFLYRLTRRAGAPQDFAQFQREQGHRPEPQPGGILDQGDRRGAKERLQGWQVMDRQLQGEASQHNHDQLHVRQESHLPDSPCVTPCSKGAAQFGNHQHGKGRIAGLGKVLGDIPLIRKGTQGHPSSEAADEDDTLQKFQSTSCASGDRGARVNTPGSTGSVASAKAGSPSVTRLIHSN